jgi:hypothetical protein
MVQPITLLPVHRSNHFVIKIMDTTFSELLSLNVPSFGLIGSCYNTCFSIVCLSLTVCEGMHSVRQEIS